jgi:peptidoglycan/xylan/chitin deacetylase (PgdA/CDA1 family)
MPRRRDPVPRAKAAGHWLGGILLLGLLAAGVVVAAVLLWENLDVRQLAPTLVSEPGPLPDPEPAVTPGVQSGPFSVALLNSPRNRSYFPDQSYYERELGRWRQLVEGLGAEVREVASEAELRRLDPDDLLLVPEAPCLSEEEVSAMLAHLDAGGGLVSNWAVGARDEECEWRGWNTISDITGAGDVRELATREALYLTVPGGMALSPGVDPGTRIEFRPEPSLALHLPGPRVYWSDWALNPAPDETGGGADVAAATMRTSSGGRGTWLGFRLSQAATPRDSAKLDRLVQNGVLWAAGRVVASPNPWPQGARAAFLLIQDVEAEYQNASAMADLLEDMGFPGTFFAVSQLVLDDPGLGGALVRAGEVGSQTSDHNPVAGLSYQDQAVRLRRSWSEIRGWTGVAPMGLRPPEESFDANTLRAWRDAGGSYVLGVNQARSGSPEIHRFGRGEPMVLLPRLLKDDYNVFVQEGALRADRLAEAFLEGTEKLRAIGGLAVVAVHTQIVGTGRRLEAVRETADSVVSQGDWWIAEAGEVAEWWKLRDGIRITVGALDQGAGPEPSDTSGVTEGEAAPPDSTRAPLPGLLVESVGEVDISELWIDVILPPGSEGMTPSVDGVPVAFITTDWGVRIALGDLSPREIKTISFPPARPQ